MRYSAPANLTRIILIVFWFGIFATGYGGKVKAEEIVDNFPLVINITELRQAAGVNAGSICAFSLEGTVLAADTNLGTIFFQDASGTEILETDLSGQPFQPGQRIQLRGTNYVVSTQNGVSLGKRPVVDNDRRHTEVECTATLSLRKGKYPIRVSWFNYTSKSFLEADWSGPDFARQRIPDSALFRLAQKSSKGKILFTNGLNYHCFEGEWENLPVFPTLAPVKSGAISNFDLKVETRNEHVALTFDGFIEVKTNGLYTFYLDSDDGSQLFIHDAPTYFKVIGAGSVPAPKSIAIRQPLPDERGAFWAETEGKVTFLGPQPNGTELELTSEDTHMRVIVCDNPLKLPEHLLGNQARVRGVCLDTSNLEGHRFADTLIAPDWSAVQILESAPELSPAGRFPKISDNPTNRLPLLTTAAEVQQLTREQAGRGYRAKIRGVVTWVSEYRDCVVLQDSTRGVFVGLRKNWIWDSPAVGEILEIEGTCVAGDFSPIVILDQGEKLGRGLLPSPMHPTWEQLISGSMDSQYIEIRGYVTAAQENHMTLLMPGGKVNVELDPSPTGDLDSFVNSVVRIRGCMFAKWDRSTLQVTPDHPLWFGNATICVDAPPPADPFAAVQLRAKSLMQFNAQADFFRRVKISGQVLGQSAGIYYLTDGGFGLRFQPRQPLSFNPGDDVDVVGLVQLGGPSPVLTEAVARKTGHSPLPPPQPLVFNDTNIIRDATRVQTKGLLVDIKNSGAEQVMEIQNGLKNFVARLPVSNGRVTSWPLGSQLKLTGIFSDTSGSPSSGNETKSFELLLNSPADVAVLALPPWWTFSRLLTMSAVLATGLALAFVWISSLRRQVERRTQQLKREIGERQRIEQERAIERERARIAQDLHDDLGSSLTAINMLAMTGSRTKLNNDTNNERFQMIVDRSRAMVTDLDALVWAVNPKNDTLFALAEYLASFAEELLVKTEITYHVELPADFPKLTLAAEARHNVLLAVKEALANALRHGKPGEILLRLTLSKDEIEIVIQDNGCGFDPNHITLGDGLINLRERMRKVNGHCRIESSPGKGATVSLILPLQTTLQC